MLSVMHTWILWLSDPVVIIQTGGYLGIALVIFAESGILLGIFFPGDSLLFTSGLLAAAGYLSLAPLVVLVIVAAILGDSVGYWFGNKIGPSLFYREESHFFKREYVTRTQQFYEQYGGRAIILARFVPIVRTFAPILAGVGSMRYHRFVAYNAVGAVLWGAGVVMLGYSLGTLFPQSGHYLLPISLLIIMVSFLPILVRARSSTKNAAQE